MSAFAEENSPASEPGKGLSRRWAGPRTIVALMLREMTTRYGRNPGGYIWAIVEPAAAIIILGFGFSLLMRTPDLGTSFLFFYASGYLPFNMYQTVSTSVARSITFSKALLQYPVVTWVDAVVARFLLNALTAMVVSVVLLTFITLYSEIRLQLEIRSIALSFGLAMLLGFGIGTVNCALISLFPTWDIVWSVVTRPLFLASGIFYLFDRMPLWVQDILWYNPLIHIVGLSHQGFFPMYTAQFVSVLYVTTWGCSLVVLGLVLLGRYHRDILNN